MLKASLLDTYFIKTINAQGVKAGLWTTDAALFIIPGGTDVPYTQKLNGEGNQVIKDYVQSGGSFLGICAGGYYGANIVEFDTGGPLEVFGTRELEFFPGKAIGPILAPYDYNAPSGVRAADIKVEIGNYEANMHLFFEGGAYFKDAEHFSNVSVIGTYQEKNLPAIIYIKHGAGHVILSGVHFEYDTELLRRYCTVPPELYNNQNSRMELVTRVLELLRISKCCNENKEHSL
jgi:biotin--protein ligase